MTATAVGLCIIEYILFITTVANFFFPLHRGGRRRSLCYGAFVGLPPADTPCRWAHVGWTLPSSPSSNSNRVVTATKWEWRGEHKGRCGGQPCASQAQRKSSWRGNSAPFLFRSACGAMTEPSLHCRAANQTGQQFSVPSLFYKGKGTGDQFTYLPSHLQLEKPAVPNKNQGLWPSSPEMQVSLLARQPDAHRTSMGRQAGPSSRQALRYYSAQETHNR